MYDSVLRAWVKLMHPGEARNIEKLMDRLAALQSAKGV